MALFNFIKKGKSHIIRDEQRNIIDIKDSNIDKYLGVFEEGVIMSNMINLFESISEIAFPVISIASCVAGGNYVLKDSKTDAIIYDNARINKFLSKPYPLYTFQQMVLLLECYQMVTGRAYLYGSLGLEALAKNRWKFCDSYSVLPSQNTSVVMQPSPKLLTAESITDIIKCYKVSNGYQNLQIEPSDIMPMTEVSLSFDKSCIEGKSRLLSAKYPVCNLIASYEARNAIYIKRGALGALVSKKSDAAGTMPLTPSEKERLRKDYEDTYGVTGGKHPIMITDVPTDFIRMAMSIEEMKPFDEHLEDALQIAGVFGYPPDLIPRKDKSTFANQNNSEKSLYNNVVIPRAKQLVQSLNEFLGLENSGMYLAVDFNHVSVLQPDRKEAAEVDRSITDTCKTNFGNGIITLNDWIAKLGGERKKEPIYNKYVYDMDSLELSRIQTIISLFK